MKEVDYTLLIEKKVKGDISAGEELALNAWVNENKENRNEYNEIVNILHLANHNKSNIVDRQKAWNQITGHIEVERKSKIPLYSIDASILALVFLSVGFLIGNKSDKIEGVNYAQVKTLPGQRSQVVLPDGSEVWLNSSSTIRYPENFMNDNRNVFITGEAFFDVKKVKGMSFVVHAEQYSINVLGTRFNVENYPDRELSETTLEEGVILIEGLKCGRKIEIKPGEQLAFNNNSNSFLKKKADASIVSSWKNNKLVFDNTPFPEIISYLENWYGVEMNTKPAMYADKRFTFTVKTESLRELLDLINLIAPINYSIDGDQVNISKSES